MITDDSFDANDLIANDWQYTVVHKHPTDFKVGELVFLKSSPEFELTVFAINEKTVTVRDDSTKPPSFYDMTPPTILQYRFAGEKTYKRKINVSLQ